MSAAVADAPSFRVPPALEAAEPPEARGLARDQVRMLVSSGGGAPDISHQTFRDLPRFLRPGDLLVVNVSATIPAALDAWRSNERIAVHVSSPHPESGWIVELRRRMESGTAPLLDAAVGERIALPGSAGARLVEAFIARVASASGEETVRLWRAHIDGVDDMLSYLGRYGAPIRYGYVRRPWPLACYQTVFAAEPGSAEMPSAGRAFGRCLVARLKHGGVRFAPTLLHTGVASLESDEPPYPERFRVTADTARTVNDTRAAAGRVIAVGTTVVRALESAADSGGSVRAAEGWTDIVVTPERGLRTVDGLLTGFHEPRASHLSMLEALVGREHLDAAYDAALEHRYLWHEFGDVHLLLTSSTTSTGLWSETERSGNTSDSSTRIRDAGRYST